MSDPWGNANQPSDWGTAPSDWGTGHPYGSEPSSWGVPLDDSGSRASRAYWEEQRQRAGFGGSIRYGGRGERGFMPTGGELFHVLLHPWGVGHLGRFLCVTAASVFIIFATGSLSTKPIHSLITFVYLGLTTYGWFRVRGYMKKHRFVAFLAFWPLFLFTLIVLYIIWAGDVQRSS